jgi:hypothetical protein
MTGAEIGKPFVAESDQDVLSVLPYPEQVVDVGAPPSKLLAILSTQRKEAASRWWGAGILPAVRANGLGNDRSRETRQVISPNLRIMEHAVDDAVAKRFANVRGRRSGL